MLEVVAFYMIYDLFGPERNSRFAEALTFFIYDTIKIYLLLSIIIFEVSIIRSYFPPEKTKKLLAHKRVFIGNILAALLGGLQPLSAHARQCLCS